jgi:CRISPR-associated protein Cas5h
MKVLVFDIFGDFAHFRKYFTTTSPLTFAFPPPITVAGILGAIYGADKKDYLDYFGYDKCKVALQIINPVQKVRMGLNLINTKDNKQLLLIKKKNHEPRTQIRTEFVRNPKYRIYFYHPEETIYDKMKSILQNHKAFYTFSLGLSELLADYQFIGEFDAIEKQDQFENISSVFTQNNFLEIKIDINKKILKDKMPLKINYERIVDIYDEVIYEAEGKPLEVKLKRFFKLSNGVSIAFF